MNISDQDKKFMTQALAQARRAERLGEVPIGALVVKDGKILAQAYNLRETRNRPTGHAELLAIEKAARKVGAWRLTGATLYVTLEPCLMCWGAVILARIPRVIFGALDPKAGVCGSVLALHEERRFNHHPDVRGGVLGEACGQVLSNFFKGLRKEKKKARK